MITEYMELKSVTDIRQWASDIVERYEGDFEKNVDAMARAIRYVMPKWGCTTSEIDWNRVETRFNDAVSSGRLRQDKLSS